MRTAPAVDHAFAGDLCRIREESGAAEGTGSAS
jgi:hypothetical protein